VYFYVYLGGFGLICKKTPASWRYIKQGLVSRLSKIALMYNIRRYIWNQDHLDVYMVATCIPRPRAYPGGSNTGGGL
jgi:hypothetical protein